MIVFRCLRVLMFIALIFSIAQFAYSQERELEELKSLDQQLDKVNRPGNYQEAVKVAQKALVIREKILGSGHPDVATSLNNLAGIYRSLGDYARAVHLCKRALAI